MPLRIVAAICLFSVFPADLVAEEDVATLLRKAKAEQEAGRIESAVALATRAIELSPDDVDARFFRAEIFAGVRQHRQAIADYTQAMKLDATSAVLFHRRGAARFKVGDVVGSIDDFDQEIRLNPRAEQSHWQRGLSYYYADQFREGQRQFELYQTYHASDVENVVWRFACQAKVDGVEAARREMLALEEPDRRIPMMKIYDLFAGKAKPEEVLMVADAGAPAPKEHNVRRFYAHLYLALYYFATDQAEKGKDHIFRADRHVISHYMWDVAHVHAQQIKATKEADTGSLRSP